MPKKAKKQVNSKETPPLVQEPVSETSDGRVVIKVLAKPGAKQNTVTGIQEEVGIQIAAQAVEGAANTELIRYLSTVLGVKKSQLTLEKGSKSRTKSVAVSRIGKQEVLQHLQVEAERNK